MPAVALLLIRISEALKGSVVVGWFARAFAGAIRITLASGIVDLVSVIANTIKAGSLLVIADNNPKLVERSVQIIADEVTRQTPLAIGLAAETITQITGAAIDKEALKTAASGSDRVTYKQTMGGEFLRVLDNMLDVPAAKRDFATRTGVVGSQTNMAAYFGTNLDFQLRSLTISTISSIFGFTSLRHLEGLHQSINWAFGFPWMSWSILSNAMDVCVNAGMKRYYLSQIKPHDLSQSQANKLRIRNILPPDAWAMIHANAGMRDDARDWQLMLEYNNASESLIQTAYERDLISESEVRDLIRTHEHTPQVEALVVTKILKHREWALRDKVTAEHLKFLRHGWETPEETRAWLNSQGWTEIEINLALEANRLEKESAAHPTSHRLTHAEIGRAVKKGLLSTGDAFAYLTQQGYDYTDAFILVSEFV